MFGTFTDMMIQSNAVYGMFVTLQHNRDQKLLMPNPG